MSRVEGIVRGGKDVVGRLFPHEPRYEMRGLEWKESSTMVIPIIIYSARETSWEWKEDKNSILISFTHFLRIT